MILVLITSLPIEKIKDKADSAVELELIAETEVFKIYDVNSQKVELITKKFINFDSPSFKSKISSLIKDFEDQVLTLC